jgi:ribosomal protein S18 acetylase RimI-like enzyme
VADERRTTPDPSQAVVREATVEDVDGIYALALELADAIGDRRPRLEPIRARLLELLEEPRARVLVAEGGGGVVGVTSLWIKPDLAHGDTVTEVPMLVVSANARCQGIGKLLIEKVRSIAATENATLLELIATRENDVARAFYRTLGFVETEHIALEYVGDMEDPPDSKEG